MLRFCLFYLICITHGKASSNSFFDVQCEAEPEKKGESRKCDYWLNDYASICDKALPVMSIVDTWERELELIHWLYWDESGSFSPEICFRIWNMQVLSQMKRVSYSQLLNWKGIGWGSASKTSLNGQESDF